MMNTETARIAAKYVAGFNLAIIALPPLSKAPTELDWPNKFFRDAVSAQRFFLHHPTHNLGCVLGPSNLCSLDVDDADAAKAVLSDFGMDLDNLVATYPTIQGNPPRVRLMFAAPTDTQLSRHSLSWPRKEDPSKSFTVCELRAGAVQDVLPPSRHPTGSLYRWLTTPKDGRFPQLPDKLLAIWKDWDAFKSQAQALCPWAERVTQINAAKPRHVGHSVIEAWGAHADLRKTLQGYGYVAAGNRYISPHSDSRLPGVQLFEDGRRCWIHHASDPLCSDESGHPVNAFDLFCHYEHGGNVKAAVKAAAQLLGIKQEPTSKSDMPPAVTEGGANREDARAGLYTQVNATREVEPASEAFTSVSAEKGADILDAVHDYLGRFVAYPSLHAQIAHTLWIAHTHLMDAWDSTPRIAFLSPEPGSGKSRALEVSELLVPRPIQAVNVTPAYLFRKVDAAEGRPTILYDEIDAVFGPRAKENEDIRAFLNAGHRRHSMTGRCGTRGNKQIVTEEFSAYCAVAVAGLGDIPDTILTRSVVVRMRRRAPDESIQPYRRRIDGPAGEALCQRLATWAQSIERKVTNPYPILPPGIVDRDGDVWEPLLAIADAAGEAWPSVARVAAVALVADAKQTTPSLGVQLLSDLKRVFGDADQLSTESILDQLHRLDEAPWGDLRGKPLDARGLSSRLRPYGVKPRNVRIGGTTPKGYRREDLHDAWARYVSVASPGSATPATDATSAADGVAHVADVAASMGMAGDTAPAGLADQGEEK
jgi:hypothetical protein